MADIIRVSGLSAGAVYLYFRSKDDLIEAAVTSSLENSRNLPSRCSSARRRRTQGHL